MKVSSAHDFMYEWETHECTVNIISLFLFLEWERTFLLCFTLLTQTEVLYVCVPNRAPYQREMSNDLKLLDYQAIWHFPNRTSQLARMILSRVYIYIRVCVICSQASVCFCFFSAIITPSTLISCWLIECNLLTHNIIILNRRFSSVHLRLHLRSLCTWENIHQITNCI